jgi:hypothetical protein
MDCEDWGACGGWKNCAEGDGLVFRARLRSPAEENGFEKHGDVLAGVKVQRGVAEQSLKRPATCQMNADATGGLASAGAEFEQLGAEGFDLGRAPGRR